MKTLKEIFRFGWERIKNNIGIIIFFIILFGIIGYCQHQKRKQYPNMVYTNMDLRIVSINSDCSLSDDKFHKPQLCNTVLFETITEPHLYCEINTCKLDYVKGIHINTEWLYNHQKGDIVHFDYLLKERFFEIKPR